MLTKHRGQEIVVQRAYLDTHVEQVVGVSAYWRLSKNRRLTPYLLFGMGLWHLADRPCVAEGSPVVGKSPPGQRFRVDFAGERPCAGKPFVANFRISPQVGVGLDASLGSRMFARVQLRLIEVRVGAGISPLTAGSGLAQVLAMKPDRARYRDGASRDAMNR